MKRIGKRPSGRDKQVDVYEFLIGIPELRNLYDILTHYAKVIPGGVDTIPIRGRIRNMRNEIALTLKEHNPN